MQVGSQATELSLVILEKPEIHESIRDTTEYVHFQVRCAAANEACSRHALCQPMQPPLLVKHMMVCVQVAKLTDTIANGRLSISEIYVLQVSLNGMHAKHMMKHAWSKGNLRCSVYCPIGKPADLGDSYPKIQQQHDKASAIIT